MVCLSCGSAEGRGRLQDRMREANHGFFETHVKTATAQVGGLGVLGVVVWGRLQDRMREIFFWEANQGFF